MGGDGGADTIRARVKRFTIGRDLVTLCDEMDGERA